MALLLVLVLATVFPWPFIFSPSPHVSFHFSPFSLQRARAMDVRCILLFNYYLMHLSHHIIPHLHQANGKTVRTFKSDSTPCSISMYLHSCDCCQTKWSLVKQLTWREPGGFLFSPSPCVSLHVFFFLARPLSCLSLQGGAEKNPVDHSRHCLFPSPSHPSLSDDTGSPLVP